MGHRCLTYAACSSCKGILMNKAHLVFKPMQLPFTLLAEGIAADQWALLSCRHAVSSDCCTVTIGVLGMTVLYGT